MVPSAVVVEALQHAGVGEQHPEAVHVPQPPRVEELRQAGGSAANDGERRFWRRRSSDEDFAPA